MYDTVENTGARLNGTVVMYDGRPVQVLNAQAGTKQEPIQVNLQFLPKMRDNILVSINDPKLEVRNLPLGYVNIYNDALYLTRSPCRQFKQGLSSNCVIIPRMENRDVGAPSFKTLLGRAEFSDAMSGIYPTYREALDMIFNDPDKKAVAFSRRFALYRDRQLGFFELRYKGNRVAWGDPNNFNLPSEFMYLSEVITEQGISVR